VNVAVPTAVTLGDRVCDRVQLALIAGERDGDVGAHVAECAECRFFDSISRELPALVAAARAQDEGPLGAALSSALAAAREQGTPLLGRYELTALLGRGGQAEVYRAIDRETGDIVAIKLVRMAAGAEARSASEVSHARRIVHPNVCRVFHTERFDTLRLIVMEHVDGPTLAARLPIDDRRVALGWFVAIAEGVQAAHAASVLHLDLKPENVLLRGGTTPVVTDFGLSVAVDREPTAKAPGGTPAYMAPEQRSGGVVDRRTDVYALGLLLRELLKPRGGRLAAVVRCATEAAPARRYQDVEELLRAVRAATRPRVRIGPALGLAALVAVSGVAVLAVGRSSTPPTTARPWRSELWGPDTIPADARNVALNVGSAPLPRAIAAPAFACARSTAELVDGITQYASWEHGFAFPPSEPVCISLDALAPKGTCGELRPDASRCTTDGRPGQLDLVLPCGERTVAVELARAHRVVAVRTWHHHPEHAPARYRIEVEDAATGARSVAFTTNNNHAARRRADFPLDNPNSGESAPVTAQFSPVMTRRVHFIMDSCTMKAFDNDKPGHGWLYEIEVFAR
jgi:hypothetical protein